MDQKVHQNYRVFTDNYEGEARAFGVDGLRGPNKLFTKENKGNKS